MTGDDALPTFEARVLARLEERACPSEASLASLASPPVSPAAAFLLGAAAGAAALWWLGVPTAAGKSARPHDTTTERRWPTS